MPLIGMNQPFGDEVRERFDEPFGNNKFVEKFVPYVRR
jgi:hypothetical protein